MYGLVKCLKCGYSHHETHEREHYWYGISPLSSLPIVLSPQIGYRPCGGYIGEYSEYTSLPKNWVVI